MPGDRSGFFSILLGVQRIATWRGTGHEPLGDQTLRRRLGEPESLFLLDD